MPTYTFAELLNHFFYFHQEPERRKTRSEVAEAIGVNRRVMADWFAGTSVPRTATMIERLAQELYLSQLQTDLLFTTVNAEWIKEQIPRNVLEVAELYHADKPRWRGTVLSSAYPAIVPSPLRIEATWQSYFHDDFAANVQRWGVGTKDNSTGRIARRMYNQHYQLVLQNHHHEEVIMSGDSNCIAPSIYYFTVHAQTIRSTDERNGYGIIFEAINDEYQTFFGLYEQMHAAAVVQTQPYPLAPKYLRLLPLPSLQSDTTYKLALVAIHNEHWFYVNDQIAGYQILPRLSVARLDVGIVASVGEEIICEFEKLRVMVP